jgi:hypothetical protein
MSGKEKGYSYSKQVVLSGDSAQFGISNTDFTIALGENLQKISRVSLVSVSFPNNSYNINATGGGTNNTYQYTTPTGLTHTATVPAGFYTTTSLMAAIQTAMQAQFVTDGGGQTITFAQNVLTQNVEATYDQGVTGVPTLLLERVPGTTVSVWDMLGFDLSEGPFTLTSGTTVAATNLPALGGLKMAYLYSNTLCPGNTFDVKGTQKNILAAIPITSQFGVSNVWECHVDELCSLVFKTTRDLQQIDFSLRDKNGNLLDLHGGNMFINLRVWFQRY